MARLESIEYSCDECATSEPAQHVQFASTKDSFTIPENWVQVVFSRGVVDDVSGKGLQRMLVRHYCPECVLTGVNVDVTDY